jgi:hypothetical protein
MDAKKGGEDFRNGLVMPRRVERDLLSRIYAANPRVDPRFAGLTELVDGPNKTIGNLALQL